MIPSVIAKLTLFNLPNDALSIVAECSSDQTNPRLVSKAFSAMFTTSHGMPVAPYSVLRQQLEALYPDLVQKLVAPVQGASDVEIIQQVQKRILKEAGAKTFESVMRKHGSRISPHGLKELAELIKANKATDTIEIFRKIAAIVPSAAIYLTALNLEDKIKSGEAILGWMRGHAEDLAQVTELKLSHLQLTYLPEEIGLLTNLNTLDVCNNQLRELRVPETLTDLHTLYADNNQLQELGVPETLIELRWLFARHNQLRELRVPETLTELRALYANNNRLTAIPQLFAAHWKQGQDQGMAGRIAYDFTNNPFCAPGKSEESKKD